ncbi:hypothetical protein ABT187_31705 [Streptomyces sp. NPDC001817]|uniref:hypothetical protein n=1 Tax=Streptomyces sp. NPDC001817 TaxID=3154398 RepID=UPI00332A392B
MSGSPRTVPGPESYAVPAVAAGASATATSSADAAEASGLEDPASAARALRAAAEYAVEKLRAAAGGVTGSRRYEVREMDLLPVR